MFCIRWRSEDFSVLPCWSEVSWHESTPEGHAATGTRRSEWRRRGNIPMSASLFYTAGNESEEEDQKFLVQFLVRRRKSLESNEKTLSSPAPSSWRSRHSRRCCWAKRRRSGPTPGTWKQWSPQEPKPDRPYWRTWNGTRMGLVLGFQYVTLFSTIVLYILFIIKVCIFE